MTFDQVDVECRLSGEHYTEWQRGRDFFTVR